MFKAVLIQNVWVHLHMNKTTYMCSAEVLPKSSRSSKIVFPVSTPTLHLQPLTVFCFSWKLLPSSTLCFLLVLPYILFKMKTSVTKTSTHISYRKVVFHVHELLSITSCFYCFCVKSGCTHPNSGGK